jgi:hypothetical protein
VSKRVDILAAAIHAGCSVEDLSDLDLSYTLPLSAAWGSVQRASHAWAQARKQVLAPAREEVGEDS